MPISAPEPLADRHELQHFSSGTASLDDCFSARWREPSPLPLDPMTLIVTLADPTALA